MLVLSKLEITVIDIHVYFTFDRNYLPAFLIFEVAVDEGIPELVFFGIYFL